MGGCSTSASGASGTLWQLWVSQESQGQPRWAGSVQSVSDADRTYHSENGAALLSPTCTCFEWAEAAVCWLHGCSTSASGVSGTLWQLWVSQESQGQPRWQRTVSQHMLSCPLYIRQLLYDPPVRRAVLPHSSARHGPAHVAHVCASLMSRSLGLVRRREPSAMTAIRARDPDGWPQLSA